MTKQERRAFWLDSARKKQRAADALQRMFEKRCRRNTENTPEADAIWEGYYSLKMRVDDAIEHLRDEGGLLLAVPQ